MSKKQDEKIKAAQDQAIQIINLIGELNVNPNASGTLKNVEDIINSKDVVKEDYDSIVANIGIIKSGTDPVAKAQAVKAIVGKLDMYLDRSLDAIEEAKEEVPDLIKEWKKTKAELDIMWKEGHKAEAIKEGTKEFVEFLVDLIDDAVIDPITDILLGESKEEQDKEAEAAREVHTEDVPLVQPTHNDEL